MHRPGGGITSLKHWYPCENYEDFPSNNLSHKFIPSGNYLLSTVGVD